MGRTYLSIPSLLCCCGGVGAIGVLLYSTDPKSPRHMIVVEATDHRRKPTASAAGQFSHKNIAKPIHMTDMQRYKHAHTKHTAPPPTLKDVLRSWNSSDGVET